MTTETITELRESAKTVRKTRELVRAMATMMLTEQRTAKRELRSLALVAEVALHTAAIALESVAFAADRVMREDHVEGVTLHASGLGSKWGFGDGDAPDDLLDWIEAKGLPIPEADWELALRKLVREKLCPLLPGVEVVDVETCHNPIRAKDMDWVEDNDDLLPDVSVTVSYENAYDVWVAAP